MRQSQETSSGGCFPDLPLSRLDPPQVRPVFSLEASEIGATLARLRGVHLRVTLLRVLLPIEAAIVVEAAASIQDPTVVVDVAPDGSVFVMTYGPRLPGPEGDRLIAAEVSVRLLGSLVHHLDLEFLAAAQVAVLHSWTDVLDPTTAEEHDLACEPLVPLHTLLRLAA